MKYQIGDMLKVCARDGDSFCVITEKRKEDGVFGVFWLMGPIQNTPGFRYWSDLILDKEFVRLS